MLSIVGHLLCLFTLKRRFFVAEVAVVQVALAETEKSHMRTQDVRQLFLLALMIR